MRYRKIICWYLSPFFLVNLFFSAAFAEEETAEVLSVQSKILSPEPVIGDESLYTLGVDDVIKITVRYQPDFSGTFIIGPDGKIQYSFIGDVQTEGLNKPQLKEVLIEKLTKYVKEPEVSIAIVEYKSKGVYVLGEVAKPGKYPMKGDSISLRDAIIMAGLPTRTAALGRVCIVTQDDEFDTPSYRKVDLKKVLYKGELAENIDLVPGDIVVVPSTYFSNINHAFDKLITPIYKAAIIEDVADRNN